MSPELFDPEKFDLKDSRQTKHSDCYALGMVMYEVLSGRVPFSRHHGPAIIGAIIKGERPGRPRGEEGRWFTGGIWSVMEGCWKPIPGDRPCVKGILHRLEGASRSLVPHSSQRIANPPMTNSPARNSDPSTEESTYESQMSSPLRTVSSQPEFPLKGDPNENSISQFAHESPDHTPSRGVSRYQLGASVRHPDRSDSEESAGILDRVSRAGDLDRFCC